jgi:hypothetical protein
MKKWTFRTALAALLAAWALWVEGTASLEVTVAASIPAALFLVGWIVGKIKGKAALVLLLLLPLACTYNSITFDEGALENQGGRKRLPTTEAGTDVPAAAVDPGEDGTVAADGSGRDFIMIVINQAAESATNLDAKLDATLEKWFSANPGD